MLRFRKFTYVLESNQKEIPEDGSSMLDEEVDTGMQGCFGCRLHNTERSSGANCIVSIGAK